jgi:pyruvate ferredoxin oxidoreductase gamma subunit
MKTASRILGSALFREGFEVQDAPRYGAERRGAPLFAYVRADKVSIDERGIIQNPDLVIVADDTLVAVPAAGVLPGVDAHTVLLINSHDDTEQWRTRLNTPAKILILPAEETIEDRAELPYVGAACVGAAARLLGVISTASLTQAIEEELGDLGPEVVSQNRQRATQAYEAMAAHAGIVKQQASPAATAFTPPDWVQLPFEDARISAPTIHAAATSVNVKTGLWRTMRPVIDYTRCNKCWWVCSSFCPDAAINVNAQNEPEIDYDHCKGCLVCVAQCPPNAIHAIPESQAQQETEETA